MNSCFRKYSSIEISGISYGSRLKKSSHNYVVKAHWKQSVFGPPLSTLPEPHHPRTHIRSIVIDYFAQITYTRYDKEDSCDCEQIFAVASWFAPHNSRHLLGNPAEV